jgi:hypothetical protein
MPINFDATNYGAATKVIAGLDPAIHRFAKCNRAKRMDPRVKPAGDDGRGHADQL